MKKLSSSRRWFVIDNFFDMKYMKMKVTSSCSPCRSGSEYILFSLERSISKSDLTSGQVNFRSGRQVMTQVRQYANIPKRLDEPGRLAPFAGLYLYPVARYWRQRIVTSYDLR